MTVKNKKFIWNNLLNSQSPVGGNEGVLSFLLLPTLLSFVNKFRFTSGRYSHERIDWLNSSYIFLLELRQLTLTSNHQESLIASTLVASWVRRAAGPAATWLGWKRLPQPPFCLLWVRMGHQGDALARLGGWK